MASQLIHERADGAAIDGARRDERRNQLAESALRTLGELGYARTSLREVAKNSEFSHGVVHYYFRDKLELILYCVRYYKAQCVTKYDGVVAEATTAEGLTSAFIEKLSHTLVEDAPMHRLWYDLRSQALFDETLHQSVLAIDEALEQMIWRVVLRYAELAGREPRVASPAAYAVLDGIFERALVGHTARRPGAVAEMVEQVRWILPGLIRD